MSAIAAGRPAQGERHGRGLREARRPRARTGTRCPRDACGRRGPLPAARRRPGASAAPGAAPPRRRALVFQALQRGLLPLGLGQRLLLLAPELVVVLIVRVV